MRTDETNPNDWFLLGRERLEAADAVRSARGVCNSAIELLQEAVERYLKGYLVGTGWPLQRIHNLSTLFGCCRAARRPFQIVRRPLRGPNSAVLGAALSGGRPGGCGSRLRSAPGRDGEDGFPDSFRRCPANPAAPRLLTLISDLCPLISACRLFSISAFPLLVWCFPLLIG
jgi:hypothetical protein